jgi:hypothetical protein
MYEHDRRDESGEVPTASDRFGPEWAERATLARRQEWASDRELDPGDAHDKGEVSLCVGEAA